MKVGVLGGGQLGQMLAEAGRNIGVDVDCYESSANVPAAATGTVTVGQISDTATLEAWAKSVDVVTYESENFPVPVVESLSQYVPVAPNSRALSAAQDRWHEKRLCEQLHLPVAPFRLARNQQDLALAFTELEAPVVVKTRTGGYDGKGQVVVRTKEDMAEALALVEHSEVVVEQFIAFDSECSIVAVRGQDGEINSYPLSRNEHRQGILHRSSPSEYPGEVQATAFDMVQKVLTRLDYVGVLAIELFETNGGLMVNEMAPRVHNSGHWTIEGAQTSQFENHLRAITGMPLGDTEMVTEAVMINVIGNTPPVEELLKIQSAHVHMYGKEPRPGRKLGHVTITGDDTDGLERSVKEVEALLT